MFLLLDGRHVGTHMDGHHTKPYKFGWNTFPNNARRNEWSAIWSEELMRSLPVIPFNRDPLQPNKIENAAITSDGSAWLYPCGLGLNTNRGLTAGRTRTLWYCLTSLLATCLETLWQAQVAYVTCDLLSPPPTMNAHFTTCSSLRLGAVSMLAENLWGRRQRKWAVCERPSEDETPSRSWKGVDCSYPIVPLLLLNHCLILHNFYRLKQHSPSHFSRISAIWLLLQTCVKIRCITELIIQ